MEATLHSVYSLSAGHPDDNAVTHHVNAFVRAFRASLSSRSETARAIDRRDSRVTIAYHAKREGYGQFAEDLLRTIALSPSRTRHRDPERGPEHRDGGVESRNERMAFQT